MLKRRYIYESSNCRSSFTSVQYSHYDPYICGTAVLSLNMLLWYWTVSVLSLIHTWVLWLPCHSHSASDWFGFWRYQTGGSVGFRQDERRISQICFTVATDITCAVCSHILCVKGWRAYIRLVFFGDVTQCHFILSSLWGQDVGTSWQHQSWCPMGNHHPWLCLSRNFKST